MDTFGILNEVLDDYRSFVQGFRHIWDPEILKKVHDEVENGLLWPEPWLALNPAFQPGGSVSDLVDRGLLHPATREVFRHRSTDDPLGREIALHRHQTDAIEIATRGESYVLTIGTGSRKSMSYLVPIVDRVLREGSGKGVRTIVVYPRNALANNQRAELEKFLGTEKPPVRFERYTGQESRTQRDTILADPPDVLLTNYVMLACPREHSSVIANAGNLSFLVLDELHTYRGRQGAGVAMLIRRLRGAIGAHQLQCVGTSATLVGPGPGRSNAARSPRWPAACSGRRSRPPTPWVSHCRATSGDPLRSASRCASSSHPRSPETLYRPTTWPSESSRGSDCAPTTRETLPARPPTGLRDAAEQLAELTDRDSAECTHRAVRHPAHPIPGPGRSSTERLDRFDWRPPVAVHRRRWTGGVQRRSRTLVPRRSGCLHITSHATPTH